MVLDDVAFRALNTRDFSKLPLWLPKIILSQLFLWPKTNDVYLKRIILFNAVISVALFITYGMIGKLLTTNLDYEFFFIVGILIANYQTIFKVLTLFYYSRELKTLLYDIMDKFWPYDLIEGKTKQNIKKIYFFVNNLMISLVIVTLLFCLGIFIPALSRGDLPFPVKYSFDWSLPVIFEIMTTIQCVGFQVLMIPSMVGTDLLFLSIGTCIGFQYRLLQQCFLKYCTPEMIIINKKLKNFENDDDNDINDERKQYFIKCVKHHQMLQRLSKLLNKIFNVVMLVQLSSAISANCLAATLIAQADNTSRQLSVPFFAGLSSLNQLLVYCVTGEMINHEAELLPQFIYESKWTNLKTKYQRDLVFFIQHAQKVPPTSAFGIFDLNMETFLKILKLSFSSYTFIKTVASK